MFLSFVIPHYNLPKELLERCINSIIAQDIPDDDYEIIIVDDGSETIPLWATDTGENIRLVTVPHSGPGGARNEGLKAASGEYIMFVDSDDYLLNNGEIAQCIEKLKSERPQILRYQYIVKKENEKEPQPQSKEVKFSNTVSGAIFMQDNNLSGSSWTFFFLRSLAIKKDIKFPTDMFHEDEEFNSIIHYHALTLIDSNATLYCYCTREGSTTANSSKEFEQKRISDIIRIIERIHFFAENNTEKSNAIQRRAIAHKLDTLVVDAILNMMYAGLSATEIRKRCKTHLLPISLYPLRKASYSLKYRIFRKLANNIVGMILLRTFIPKRKPTKK